MRSTLAKMFTCCFIVFLLEARTCMADTKINATLLYAITDSLSLDENGNLSYSRILDGRSQEGKQCPPFYQGDYYCISKASASNLVLFDSQFSLDRTYFYYDLWFDFIDQYPLLVTTINQLLAQVTDIASRLEVLHKNRSALQAKYGRYRDESFLEPIDKDIKYLSSLGIQLRDVSRRFFSAVKSKIIDAEIEKDVLEARTEGMRGLTTFERELQGVTAMPDDAVDRSLEQIVAAVDKAVAELERAIAE